MEAKDEIVAVNEALTEMKKVIARPPKFKSEKDFFVGAAKLIQHAQDLIGTSKSSPGTMTSVLQKHTDALFLELLDAIIQSGTPMKPIACGGEEEGDEWLDKTQPGWAASKKAYNEKLCNWRADLVDTHLPLLKADRP